MMLMLMLMLMPSMEETIDHPQRVLLPRLQCLPYKLHRDVFQLGVDLHPVANFTGLHAVLMEGEEGVADVPGMKKINKN